MVAVMGDLRFDGRQKILEPSYSSFDEKPGEGVEPVKSHQGTD